MIGLYYDNYRNIEGPRTIDIGFYLFGIYIEIGPRFDYENVDD
jgi:hypothetical protein